MRQGWWVALIVAMTMAIIVLSWGLGYRCGVTAAMSDTCDTAKTAKVVRDTVTIECPVPVLIDIGDTILVPDPDTVLVHDTVFVKLPKESKEYSGKDFRAVVSGFQPSLDLIQVFPETRTITQTISAPPRKSPRWSVGVQAGYGIAIRDNRISPAPYLGLGVSYSLIQIPSK